MTRPEDPAQADAVPEATDTFPIAGFGTPPPIPLTPDEAARTDALNKQFHRVFVENNGENGFTEVIRTYQELKEDVLARTYRFGLVNNRLYRAAGTLVAPYLICDTLVIYRVTGDGVGARVTTHRIDPGTLLTDKVVCRLSGVTGERIDLENAIYDIDPEQLHVGPTDRLRDIAALLRKVNGSTNRNVAVYYLRHLVARLARPGGMQAEAKNMLPEVHEVTRELVTFLNSQSGRRLRLLARITVRNLPALLGRPNLLDRLWSDTIDLAEVHVVGSSVVNEIRRTAHHALGKRTLRLARGYAAYLDHGDWSALVGHGYAAPSLADQRARNLEPARTIVHRIVGDLEQLLGATEILSRLENWRDSYLEALLRCSTGRSLLEERDLLLAQGVRPGNRWAYLQQIRRLREKAESFKEPREATEAFLEQLREWEAQPPPGHPFDADRVEQEVVRAVDTYVQAVRAYHLEPLLAWLEPIERAYRARDDLETFRRIRTARCRVFALAAQGAFQEQRYHLQRLDCLLEEMGYLALRHFESRVRTSGGLETCFDIIRLTVRNLEFDGLESRELLDLSDMLDTSAYGLDKDELRTTVANIQRYLLDLNAMVGYCDVARRWIQEKLSRADGRSEAGGPSPRSSSQPVAAEEDPDASAVSRKFPFKIRHISHRESVAPLRRDRALAENLRDECGGKGSGLLYINHLNIPTRDGFILPTTIPRARAHIDRRGELEAAILEHLRILEGDIETRSGEKKRFGDPRAPLLLAVRGGSVFSMPGILSTVVFVGMNDEIAQGLAQDGPWRAYDSYRRFLASYAWSAWGFDVEPFSIVDRIKEEYGVKRKEQLPWTGMLRVAEETKQVLRESGYGDALDEILNDLHAQLFGAVYSIFDSWDSLTARRYREIKGLCHSWQTAVIIQEMAFGNRANPEIRPGMDETQASLTGVIPRTVVTDSGMWRLQGEFKFSAAGDDLVGGITSSQSIRDIEELHALMPVLALRLKYAMSKLRRFMGMDQEVEFTVDRGRLSVLQVRAAVAAADQPADRFVDPGQPVARGLGIRGGGFRGFVAFDEDDIQRYAAMARDAEDVDGVVFVIENPTPDDIPLIISADAVMTARGGSTSHAAIAVNGVEDKRFFGVMSVVGLVVRPQQKEAVFVDASGAVKARVGPGDVISLHGTTGEVFLGSKRIERVGP